MNIYQNTSLRFIFVEEIISLSFHVSPLSPSVAELKNTNDLL
jgi:hypothetical protein